MQTLYIDVYFLVNFTVDLLSLYYASLFSKIPTTIKRLMLSAFVATVCAVCVVFLNGQKLLGIAVAGLGLVLAVFICIKPVTLKRRIKFLLSFLLFEGLIGGIVSFVWGIFDEYLYDAIASESTPPVNRKLLLFSLVVLIAIGVIKMIVSFFSNIVSEGSVELEISFLGKKTRVEAFVDSGNLAIDPMDMQPVVLIKRSFAKKFLPQNLIELRDPDSLDKATRKKIRLVPISYGGATRVLTGIKADEVNIVAGDKRYEISVTIAIDRDDGTFGGFYALIPAEAVSDVKN